MTGHGPLHGVRVIELAGIGPGPYAAMLLADLGAEVVRVERPGPPVSAVPPEKDVLRRNRRSIVVDLRHSDGVSTVLSMVERAMSCSRVFARVSPNASGWVRLTAGR